MAAFCARAAERGIPAYLYGGRTPEALALLQARLRERFPGLPIAGAFSPPFRPLDEAERAEVVRRIDESGAAHMVDVTAKDATKRTAVAG